MNILVVGGAGYIGSHMVKFLHHSGCTVTTIDNLSTGYRDAVLYGKFVKADIADPLAIESVLSSSKFDAVMHFASCIEVGESIIDPAKYYKNNVAATITLLDAMRKYNVDKFIFSSTAATFGEPIYLPIDERHPQRPINPYGRTKLVIEGLLSDYGIAYGLKSVCLRYFNASGADPEGQLGERHEPESHLVPIILQAASGRRSHVTVFGRDYDTPDGTCIRDYVHVADICQAHWLALNALFNGLESQSFNLGNGDGFSVNEVIEFAKEVTEASIKVLDGERRLGDPAKLVADCRKAQTVLGWEKKFSSMARIIEHAWRWELDFLSKK
jgi:UDP-glucose 4-epimerase